MPEQFWSADQILLSRLTKKDVRRRALTYEQRTGTHKCGARLVVAQLGNTFGTGEREEGALDDLCAKLGAR